MAVNNKYVHEDHNGQEIRGVSYEKLSAHPTGAGLYEGRFWQLTTDNHIYLYSGASIRQVILAEDLNKFGTLVGGHDASGGGVPTIGSGTDNSGNPDNSIEAGDYWRITVAGTISGLASGSTTVAVGDMLIALSDNAATGGDFMAIQLNIDEASIGSGSNIYNINGTLTADRTLSGGGFALTFTGLSSYGASAATISLASTAGDVAVSTDSSGALLIPSAADPDTDVVTPTNGAVKYSESLNQFRFYENNVWRTFADGLKEATKTSGLAANTPLSFATEVTAAGITNVRSVQVINTGTGEEVDTVVNVLARTITSNVPITEARIDVVGS